MARRFAQTWWGRAWIDALENRARLDPNRLPRGRTYARQDRVFAMAVEPGAVSARVQGSRVRPYSVRIDIRPFTSQQWERVLDAIAAKARFSAAMLDGEMDPGVVEAVAGAGVELFPTAGELVPHCSCPDWADPCKHSAAVCYLIADRLDVDPFDLLVLRGMERGDVIAALRARRSTRSVPREPSAPRDTTMRARDAWNRRRGALPAIPTPPRHLGRPAPWPAEPPADAGVDADGLRVLAADTVQRAFWMAAGYGDSALSLDLESDVARRASSEDRADLAALVMATGFTEAHLRRLGRLWAAGGSAALDVAAEQPWTPDPLTMAEAKQRLAENGVRSVRASKNTLTWGSSGIRRAHDGRWWPIAKRSGRWEIWGSPSEHPEDLVNDGALE